MLTMSACWLLFVGAFSAVLPLYLSARRADGTPSRHLALAGSDSLVLWLKSYLSEKPFVFVDSSPTVSCDCRRRLALAVIVISAGYPGTRYEVAIATLKWKGYNHANREC